MSRFTQETAETAPSDQVLVLKAALESDDNAPTLAMLLFRLPGIITLELSISDISSRLWYTGQKP